MPSTRSEFSPFARSEPLNELRGPGQSWSYLHGSRSPLGTAQKPLDNICPGSNEEGIMNREVLARLQPLLDEYSFDDLVPARFFGSHERSELFRCLPYRQHTMASKLSFHFRVGKCLNDR